MCDSSPELKDYFNKHLALMRDLGQNAEYEDVNSVEDFFKIE